MALETYYDFAENDFKFLKDIINEGRFCNGLASMSQNVCERYLKHIIDTYYIPDNQEKSDKKTNILKAHNLNKICKFIKNDMNIFISKECQCAAKVIDGFYFTARYPGDESVDIDIEDMKDCLNAMNMCKIETDKIIELMNNTKQDENCLDFGNDIENDENDEIDF